MKSLPPWAKVLAAIVVTAALFGAARLLIWIDQLNAAKVGLD